MYARVVRFTDVDPDHLAGRLAEAEGEVEELEAVERHLERVTRELEDIKSSTSWRLTLPLRRLSDQLRARRNGTPQR